MCISELKVKFIFLYFLFSIYAFWKSNSINSIFFIHRCGFEYDLCTEALQICDDDVGSALEYLLNELYNIKKSTKDNESVDAAHTAEEIEVAREDEKLALESMYDNKFEEKLAGKVWSLAIDLPHLSELILKNNSAKKKESQDSGQKSTKGKKLCPFFLKGTCKFKDRCRLSHSRPEEKRECVSHPIYDNLKYVEGELIPYNLEIRFPDGNKYPFEAPLLAFSTTMDAFPNHSRLNISQYLMSLAKESAEQHLPCVFTLVSALEDVEKLQELLSLPPMHKLVKQSPSVHPNSLTSTNTVASYPDEIFEDGSVLPDRAEADSGPPKSLTESFSKINIKKKEFENYRVGDRELRHQNKSIQIDFKKKQVRNALKMSQKQYKSRYKNYPFSVFEV